MSNRPAIGRSSDRLLACAVFALAGVGAVIWLARGLSSLFDAGRWRDVPVHALPVLVLRVLANPRSLASIGSVSPPALCVSIVVLVLLAASAIALWRRRPRRRPPGARWASAADLSPLLVRAPGEGRVVVGRLGRRLVALEQRQSLLVVGPTQSGKTSGLAIPAIEEWDGPVLATSVKTDLVIASRAARERRGTVLVYDPLAVSGVPGAGWSPLAESRTWAGARRVAAGLCAVQREGAAGLEDAAFWYATAEKLLAPLLFAAAKAGASMSDVVRWVDTWEEHEVLSALDKAGAPEALAAAEASFGRDERQRSSVYTTAETVLAAFADPAVAAASEAHHLDPQLLLDGGAHTVYLVAPAHEQERLQAVFVAIVKSVLDAAFTASLRCGGPLTAPLLVVLDEAANVAPLSTLDRVAATASSHGIQLVTIWQDLAQIEARYQRRAATIVNNHRAKLVCSGIADPTTLEQLSSLIGEEEREVDSTSSDSVGNVTTTRSLAPRRLAPVDFLRRLRPGEAVLLYGHHPPARLVLRRPIAPQKRARERAASTMSSTWGSTAASSPGS